MTEGFPPPEPVWPLRMRSPQEVVWQRAGQEGVVLRCHPPLPQPLPPGFRTELHWDGGSDVARLWPAEEEGQLWALSKGAVAGLQSEMLEALVNHIAHDLRNLFFTVSLQAELAARVSGEAKPHVEVILHQLGRVQEYLERLLLYGREPILSLTTLNVETFLRERLRSLRQQWPADQPPVSVRLQVDGDAGLASWDPHLLGHAVDAVLDNAARATPPGREVTVTVRATATHVVLEIRDQGPGIPPSDLPRVFVPMATRRPTGLGLGLPIARKMVEAHGGSLTLSSGGQGTTVTLRLPREAKLG